MRTVRVSWLKVLLAVFVTFVLLFLVYNNRNGSDLDSVPSRDFHINRQVARNEKNDEENTLKRERLNLKQKFVQDQRLNKDPVSNKKVPVFLTGGRVGRLETTPEPRTGPGENGARHKLKPHQKGEEQRLLSTYGFNQLVSDEISLDRNVPDLRPDECKHWEYPEDLPTASVVFIFHNEGWSTLLRSVHSVINRSPKKLLHEIVLVDDKSELEHLHERLEREIREPYYQGKVKLVRNTKREGLIRSRNNGAIAASGEVVIFLDAHCEVGHNWLPPLLAPILENPKTLTAPIVDGIEWNDFSIREVYSQGQLNRGIFEWGMLYKEGPLPEKEANKREHWSAPYNSPTHAGGLFAIKRSWFQELGWYDPGLLIWGGENYELSFKLWQCGGRQMWVPCSHVGHVYRGHGCSSCHSGQLDPRFVGIPLAMRNYKRVIETWFDKKHKEFFYTIHPEARYLDMGDISAQLAIKERLQCKSFTWFMKEIAYDVYKKYPEQPQNAYWGSFKHTKSNLCLYSGGSPPSIVRPSSYCGDVRLNVAGQLTTGEWCIYFKEEREVKGPQLRFCKDGDASGQWSFETGNLKYAGKCVAVDGNKIKLKLCTSDEDQKWTFNENMPWWAHKKL